MKEIFIKHNPYRLTTEIKVDGNSPKKNSRLDFEDRRIQEWVDELPQILVEECNTKDFKIVFHGTLLDYEDVDAMAKDAKKDGINIELEHIKAKEFKDKEKAIQEVFDEIQNGPFEELKETDVKKAFELAKSDDFEVNVVATMSAGKSTLINSLLRQKLMPAKQEACTATITEIKDNDEDTFIAKAYDSNGSHIQTHSNLTYDIMEQLNANKDVSKIRIEGDIPFVDADDVSLVLVDTPGPNNSRDLDHKAATYRMLSESSKTVVLYIMNATQLAVNDDYNLISHVADSMKVGGKQSRDRFIFVINKLDDFKKGEDSVESAINKVREYLKDNGIENPNIYPASALTALNIRTVLDNNYDEDEDEVLEAQLKVRKFNKNEEMYFEKYAPLTPFLRGEVENMLSKAVNDGDDKTQALIHCGIIPIEQAIKLYVQKYAKTAKIKNIVDTFVKKLESTHSFETAKQEISKNKDKQEEVLIAIEKIKAKIESGENGKKYKEQIDKKDYKKEMREKVNQVIAKAQNRITEQLTTSDLKLTKKEAELTYKNFVQFTENLQAEIKVKLEDILTNNIKKNSEYLIDEYKKVIAELSEDIKIENININPFEIMSGKISGDYKKMIEDITHTESVRVGEKWIENTDKAWYKPWTWFQEKGHFRGIYEDREYVDGEQLAQKFFGDVQVSLHENSNDALKYADEQTKKIKELFNKKFDELNDILNKKMKELEDFVKNKEDIESKIQESQKKLEWLENIQYKVNSILEI